MSDPRIRLRRDQRGVTLIELVVGMTLGIVMIVTLVAFLGATQRSSARTSARTEANGLARPVMQRIVDELHSTCLAPGLAPVLAGSSADVISFIHQTGSAASLNASRREISFESGALQSATYAQVSGSAPNWVFSSTPSPDYQMLADVSRAKLGAPAVEVPIFRYYAYSAGTISATPLPVPLSAGDAVRTVLVTVSFATSPGTKTTETDANAAVNLSGSALLRFSPSNEDTSQAGLPCT